MRLNMSNHVLDHASQERSMADPIWRASELGAVLRLLPEGERRLVDSLFVQQQSYREIAATLGLTAGVVCRRARRIRNRLACPTLRAVARSIDALTPEMRRIAVEHVIGGVPVNVIARTHGLTRRDVQRQVDYVRGWARGLYRGALRATAVGVGDDE